MGGNPSKSSYAGYGQYPYPRRLESRPASAPRGERGRDPQPSYGAAQQGGEHYDQDPQPSYYFGAAQLGGGYVPPYSVPLLQDPTAAPTLQASGSTEPRLDEGCSRITGNYDSVDQVSEALAHAGLKSSNLILGIDFTRSNEWTGEHSFSGCSLHAIGHTPNPYEETISIVGQTLSAFDKNDFVHCFGFGDEATRDKDVFCFYPDERPCNGFKEAVERYKDLLPHLNLAGPTSFAPLIEMAMTIVDQSGGQHHVLLIISDGQVAHIDTESGQMRIQDHKTFDAIANASKCPLSIVLVGVGDGPWNMMMEFDNHIPARDFDNFQFVNFSEIMSKNSTQSGKEAALALAALSKLPQQYKSAMELGILGLCSSISPGRVPLPPPGGSSGAHFDMSESFRKASTDVQNLELPLTSDLESAMAGVTTTYCEYEACPVCYTNAPDETFSCGHRTCGSCGSQLKSCPICRSPITTRVKLYNHYTADVSTTSVPASNYSDQAVQVCPICLVNPKDMAFGCGHQTCCECGDILGSCPICRIPITIKVKLY
ncbi:unnamed protein product [Urochloa humidicola]